MTKLGMVIPTYGKQCGIAAYTNNLLSELQKLEELEITILGEGVFDYMHCIYKEGLDVVHFQLEYQFYSPKRLEILLKGVNRLGKKSVVTMHTVHLNAKDHNWVINELSDLVLVHSNRQKEEVTKLMNKVKVEIVTMGCPNIQPREGVNRKMLGLPEVPIIATFGMGYFHKGIKELVLLSKEFPGYQFLIVSSKPSQDTGYFIQCKALTEQLKNILWVEKFIPEQQVVELLSMSDLIVLPYQEYGGIATSASLKTVMCANAPILVSDTCFFDDVDAVMKFKGKLDKEVIENVLGIIKIHKEMMVGGITKWRTENSWSKSAMQHKRYYEGLVNKGVEK